MKLLNIDNKRKLIGYVSTVLAIFNIVFMTVGYNYPILTLLLILNALYLNFLVVIIVKNKFNLVSLLTLSNLFSGSFGFFVLSGYTASFIDCFYMTIITLSTVGFTEVVTTGNLPMIRVFTIYIILMGLGNLLLVLSGISNYLIEGKLQIIFERRKLMSRIERINNHIIVCGGGGTSEHIISELVNTKRPFVVIEKDEDRCTYLESKFVDAIVFQGDATEDKVLLDVGIQKASSLVAILPQDKDNLFLTITTHHLNKNCRVVSKTMNLKNKAKLIRAGASSVVPNRYISALRIVSEVISPNVVTFLDTMMRTGNHRVVEISVNPESVFCGKTIHQLVEHKKIDFNVVSYRYQDSVVFNYNPKLTDIIQENMVLIFIMDPVKRSFVDKVINS